MRKLMTITCVLVPLACLIALALAGPLIGPVINPVRNPVLADAARSTLVVLAALSLGFALSVGWVQHQREKALKARLEDSLALFRRIQEISSDATLSLDKQIDALLDVGRKLLRMPLAIVSCIDGDEYLVKYVRGNADAPPEGARFALGDTYCSHTLKAGKPTSFHNASKSEIRSHPCYINSRLESYIGMAFQVGGKPYGTLNFSSPHARLEPFNERDFEFLAVLAFWIGSRLTQQNRERESRKLSDAFQHALAGMSYLGVDGRFQSVNTAYAEMVGYQPDELVGRDCRRTVHSADISTLERAYQIARTQGRATAELRSIRKDGRQFFKQITLVAERDERSELAGYYCFAQDVTEAIAVRASMARQQALFEALFRDSPEPMVICDIDRRITAINPAFTESFGYAPADVLGKTTAVIYPSVEEYEARGRERFNLTAEEKRLPYEQVYRRKNGERFLSETVGTVLKDGSGKPMGFFGHIRDISERKRLDRMKDEFIATVSHELRTPLTSIRGAVGLLAAGQAGPLSAGAKQLTRVAERNSERLICLINDILDMENIAAGRLRVQTRTESALELVEQTIESNRGYAGQHRVALHIEQRVQAFVEVDAGRFEQVLTNLLSNAVKFSPAGERVAISMERRGSLLRVSVADNGKGIPESFKDSVFERFCQADASDQRHNSGTGLGLAISKALVEAMDGRIGFTSAEGIGSTFWLEVPIVEVHQETEENASEAVPENSPKEFCTSLHNAAEKHGSVSHGTN